MYYLNQDELRALLSMAYENDRLFHLALLTTVSHGLRMAEMLDLTVDDIYARESEVSLFVRGKKKGLEQLRTLHKSSNPLFDESALVVHAAGVRKQGGKYLFTHCQQRYNQKLQRYGRMVGIDPRKLHWHALRHSHAMLVWSQSQSLGQVKQALRHKSWSTSLVYLSEADNVKALESRDRALSYLAAH